MEFLSIRSLGLTSLGMGDVGLWGLCTILICKDSAFCFCAIVEKDKMVQHDLSVVRPFVHDHLGEVGHMADHTDRISFFHFIHDGAANGLERNDALLVGSYPYGSI